MKKNQAGYWLAVGVALGAGIGVALHNIAIGVAIGAGVGVAMMAAGSRKGGDDVE